MDDDEHARTLVDRARAGDEDASRELIRQLYPLVAKIVHGYRPRRAAEEDLAQMIFIKVFQNINQYAGKAPFGHWVARIAVNTCRNQVVAEKSRPELRYADLSEEQVAVLENVASEHEPALPDQNFATRDLVEKLLTFLKPAERLVIDMLYLQQKTVAEVRALTGWSTSLIKVRAFRARQKMRNRVGTLT